MAPRPNDDTQLTTAQLALIKSWVDRKVAEAPPLTEEQITAIVLLFRSAA